MSWFNIFLHPPISLTLWWYDKKYGCIWMHIGPSNKAMVTLLELLCPEKWGKRQNHMGKILPQDRTRHKIWNMYVFNISLSSLESAEWTSSGWKTCWRNHELHDHVLECRTCKKDEERLLVSHHLMKWENYLNASCCCQTLICKHNLKLKRDLFILLPKEYKK